MERLTGKKKGVVGLKDCLTECKHPINGCDCRNVRSALRQLAAYEDTGLSPEDCAEYKKFEDEIIKSGKSFQRIIELVQADKGNRCVVLPCNVGDTVYTVESVCHDSSFAEDSECPKPEVDCDKCWMHESKIIARKFSYDLLNMKLFSTREEAEAALKEGD